MDNSYLYLQALFGKFRKENKQNETVTHCDRCIICNCLQDRQTKM